MLMPRPVDFGLTADDYGKHRAGFPEAFFERIQSRGLIPPGARLLDLGSGTGTIARGMAARGCRVFALDISAPLLRQARVINKNDASGISGIVAAAEQIPAAADSFDVVTAGQCWHWFDGLRAAREAKRILVPGGTLIIAHFDWLPYAGNVVAATEALILRHNPAWAFAGGDGFHLTWLEHLRATGFIQPETFSFDLSVAYSHAAWRGRIRASAGVAASLSRAQVDAFDRDLRQLLRNDFPADPLEIPHRVFAVLGKAAG